MKIREELTTHLTNIDNPHPIRNLDQLDVSCNVLIKALQETIEANVPIIEICSNLKI